MRFDDFWASDGVDIYRSISMDDALVKELCELAFKAGLQHKEELIDCADQDSGTGEE